MDQQTKGAPALSREEQMEKYRSEESRRLSFKDWPNWAKVAPDDLAKAGFFYLGKHDAVKCFACGVEVERWDRHEDAMSAHLGYSPTCPFLLSVGYSASHEPHVQRSAAGQYVNVGGATVLTPQFSRSMSQESGASLSSGGGSLGSRRTLDRTLSTPGSLSYPVQATHSSIEEIYSFSEAARHGSQVMEETSSFSGAALHGSQVMEVEELPGIERLSFRDTQEVRDKILTVPPQEGLTEYCPRDDLISLLPDATHPVYGHINDRIATYSTWPREDTVQAKTLAQAGFFCLGESDKVRCFMCGGTVCSWEREDIPWHEHSRWYGDCPYLRQCMKHPVVQATVETAQRVTQSTSEAFRPHHHGSGHTQCDVERVKPRADGVPMAPWGIQKTG